MFHRSFYSCFTNNEYADACLNPQSAEEINERFIRHLLSKNNSDNDDGDVLSESNKEKLVAVIRDGEENEEGEEEDDGVIKCGGLVSMGMAFSRFIRWVGF